jgi:protein-disulfide isomerase
MAVQQKVKRKTVHSSNSGVKPLIFITIGFVIVIILLIVLASFRDKEEQIRYSELPSIEGQQVMGDLNAPVTIFEFGDYMCPTCARWDFTVFPKLYDEYIKTGKANYVFINTLFHGSPSELAALASESVYEQSKEHFWDFHHAIFKAQAEATSSDWASIDLFVRLAKENVPGIDLDKLRQDLENKTAKSKLETDMRLVDRYNVMATPTIMINGVVSAYPMDYSELSAIIEQELGESGQ